MDIQLSQHHLLRKFFSPLKFHGMHVKNQLFINVRIYLWTLNSILFFYKYNVHMCVCVYLPIHEHGMCFYKCMVRSHSFRSSLISFNHVLYGRDDKFYIYFAKFIPKYFIIFDAIVNEGKLLILILACLLLLCGNEFFFIFCILQSCFL